jgi:hypothetical protein
MQNALNRNGSKLANQNVKKQTVGAFQAIPTNSAQVLISEGA